MASQTGLVGRSQVGQVDSRRSGWSGSRRSTPGAEQQPAKVSNSASTTLGQSAAQMGSGNKNRGGFAAGLLAVGAVLTAIGVVGSRSVQAGTCRCPNGALINTDPAGAAFALRTTVRLARRRGHSANRR